MPTFNKTQQKAFDTLRACGWSIANGMKSQDALDLRPSVFVPYHIPEALVVADGYSSRKNDAQMVMLIVPPTLITGERGVYYHAGFNDDSFIVISSDGAQLTVLRKKVDRPKHDGDGRFVYRPYTLRERLAKAAGYVLFSPKEVKALSVLKVAFIITNRAIYAYPFSLDRGNYVLTRPVANPTVSNAPNALDPQSVIRLAWEISTTEPFPFEGAYPVRAYILHRILYQIGRFNIWGADGAGATLERVKVGQHSLLRILANIRVGGKDFYSVSAIAEYPLPPTKPRDPQPSEPTKWEIREISDDTPLEKPIEEDEEHRKINDEMERRAAEWEPQH